MSLLSYRLRPVPWLPMCAVSGGWAAAVVLLGPSLGPRGMFQMLEGLGLLMGIEASFTLSSEVDPPRVLLETTPKPYLSTVMIRLGAWLAVGHLALAAVSIALNGRWAFRFGTMMIGSVPALLFASGLALVLAALFGSYTGGAMCIGALGLMVVAQASLKSMPLELLDIPGTRSWRIDRVWILAFAFAYFMVGIWLLNTQRNRRSPRWTQVFD